MDGNIYRYDDQYYERKIEINDMEYFVYNGFHTSMQQMCMNQPYEPIIPNYGLIPDIHPVCLLVNI